MDYRHDCNWRLFAPNCSRILSRDLCRQPLFMQYVAYEFVRLQAADVGEHTFSLFVPNCCGRCYGDRRSDDLESGSAF